MTDQPQKISVKCDTDNEGAAVIWIIFIAWLLFHGNPCAWDYIMGILKHAAGVVS